MAYIRSYDSLDTLTPDLSAFYYGTVYSTDSDVSINGRSYADVVSFQRSTDMVRTFDLLGDGITIDTNGLPLSGTVTAIYMWFYQQPSNQWFYNFFAADFSIPATEFATALRTAGTADDRAITAKILATNDTIILSEFADRVDGMTGSDRIYGNGGDDTLSGGAGNDIIHGGRGEDRISGGTGRDRLVTTRDGSVDSFVFTTLSGSDTIAGFEDGLDRIVIRNGAERMSDLTITDLGPDVLVSFGSVRITLVGLDPSDLTRADFIFV